jgi:hypothetical protein
LLQDEGLIVYSEDYSEQSFNFEDEILFKTILDLAINKFSLMAKVDYGVFGTFDKVDEHEL